MKSADYYISNYKKKEIPDELLDETVFRIRGTSAA